MKYEFGLCSGRHDIPVKDYIFGEIEDPTNFDALRAQALAVIPLDADEVTVYVTGLTPALLAVIGVCQDREVTMNAMNYDRVSGEYKQQGVLLYRTCPFCGRRYQWNAWSCSHCGAT